MSQTPCAAHDSRLDLLQVYLDDVRHGRPPARDAVLARHPDLASLLDRVDGLDAGQPPTEVAPEPAGPPGALPRAFGKYVLEYELGRGGMGVVYKARQLDLDRPVALKMILGDLVGSPVLLGRFEAEARAAARVNHPHVVGVYEAGAVGGQPYFTMEYVAAHSLDHALEGGPLEPARAARIVAAVAAAVDHLHRCGIVHRDLKPSNILLGLNDHPYVTDFGLVKFLADGADRSASGSVVGTPAYMAPEQAAGRAGLVGPQSDVYSLGAILYEVLTGQPPFGHAGPLETLVHVLESEPVAPRALRPELPAALERLCLRCLEKDPGDRFASARDLAEALERFLQGEDAGEQGPGPVRAVHRWARREPALAARLAMLSASAVVAQVNYQFFSRSGLALHATVLTVLAAWAAVSFCYQRLLGSRRWAEATRPLWACLDVAFFALLVLALDGIATPLAVGFPLLVAAAGLWFRVGLVWLTAGLSGAAYAALLAEQAWRHGRPEGLHLHAVFLAGMATLAAVMAYQVRRVRALSNYYTSRPLP